MCGVHGFFGHDPARLYRMVAGAVNRGPDGVGVYQDDAMSLGQNLLSIMDIPVNSRQPWVLDDRRGVLCFNGQIYNWEALGRELGARLHTRCDTEVLAEGLAAEGEAFLEKIEGMYAVAFYSPDAGEILLARDPAGMKPLYYVEDGERLAFSSEMRALASEVTERRLDPLIQACFFELGYAPGPRTLIQGLSKLMPGEWRRYRVADGKLLAQGFTGRAPVEPQRFKNSRLRRALNEAVGACSLGMRPLGLYLSGGMDSAAVLHEARELGLQLSTYSTVFSGEGLEAYNEDARLAARLAADYGYDHTMVEVTPERFVTAIEQAVDVVEEPRYNRSGPAYLLTAEALAADGVIVTLSGDGGDEMLAGYPKYVQFMRAERAGLFEKQSVQARTEVLQRLGHKWRWECEPAYDLSDPVHRWYYISKWRLEERGLTTGPVERVPTEEILDYLGGFLSGIPWGEDRLNDHLLIDQATWLPEDALTRNDKIGMAFGMEGRFPLVTRGFRDYAMSLPSHSKVVGKQAKYCMRRAYEDVLPDYIVKRPKKTGWAAPVLVWAESDPYYQDAFNNALSGAAKSGLLPGTDWEAIRDSGEPKVQYAGMYLASWAKRWGVTS